MQRQRPARNQDAALPFRRQGKKAPFLRQGKAALHLNLKAGAASGVPAEPSRYENLGRAMWRNSTGPPLEAVAVAWSPAGMWIEARGLKAVARGVPWPGAPLFASPAAQTEPEPRVAK